MSAPKGPYVPVLPLDKLILGLMPKEGSTFMSVYPEAVSVINMQKEIEKITGGTVPTSVISSRVRLMNAYGFVVKVFVPRQNTAGWQITPSGEALFPSEVRDGSPA
jgi:hypothetical protein